RRAGAVDEPRVPRAVLPDAPPRPRCLAGGADRAHLRAGRRSRFEHGRSLRRAAEAQARRDVHRNRARARIPHRRGAAGMNFSLRTRVMLGAALWSVGLFVVTGVLATVLMLHFQSMPYVLHTMFGHSVISGAVALAFMLAGFWQVRKGMS